METLAIKNKQLSKKYWQYVWEKRDLHLASTLLADNMIYSAPRIRMEGKVKILEMIQRYMNAFSDSNIIIEDQIAEGNKVFTRAMFKGIHSGPLGTMPPTHKNIKFQLMNVVQIDDGKITHEWEVYDQLGLMQQLGLDLAPRAEVHY